jgi:hypothetical protein
LRGQRANPVEVQVLSTAPFPKLGLLVDKRVNERRALCPTLLIDGDVIRAATQWGQAAHCAVRIGRYYLTD